jgi:hypothetical protein
LIRFFSCIVGFGIYSAWWQVDIFFLGFSLMHCFLCHKHRRGTHVNEPNRALVLKFLVGRAKISMRQAPFSGPYGWILLSILHRLFEISRIWFSVLPRLCGRSQSWRMFSYYLELTINTGPRELSIRDPKGIPLILGFTSKPFKEPFYDSMEDSVSTMRDKVFYKQRRKVWDTSMKSCECHGIRATLW